MAAEDLPSEFDVVIVGTGLCESVVAAACSRVGQRVLHLDRRSFYAGDWASFTFNGLQTWIQEQQAEPQPEPLSDWSDLLEEGEELVPLNQCHSSISNVQVYCYISEEETDRIQDQTQETDIDLIKEEKNEAEKQRSSEEKEKSEVTEGEESVADSLSEPGAVGGSQSEAGAVVGSQSEPGAVGGSQSEPGAVGGSQSEPGAVGGSQSEPGTVGGSQSEPGAVGGSQLEPGAVGGSQSELRKLTLSDLLKEGRRFNIDLVSKLLFSRGSLVDLLIQSNVSRYAEFKNVSRVLTVLNGKVLQVPCSRADVFSSRHLSVVDKRKLMKFLTSCSEENNLYSEFSGRPYMEFLERQQLGSDLRHFLFHSIAMATEDTPTEAGLASTRHFLRCLGRYGNTPFLFPVYGLGEIPQCFCRMCAVFGGVYCLRHSVRSLILEKHSNRCTAVIDSRGQRISCSHCVLESGLLGSDQNRTRSISRAVLVTDRSLLPSASDQQQVSLVTVPGSEPGSAAVRLIELSPNTMTCISGTFLVHLTCPSRGSAHSDLFPVVTSLFRTPQSPDHDRPSVLWSLYFNMADSSEVIGHDLPINVHLSPGPDSSLGHDSTISKAEQIFLKMVPGEEFCPPAPNPEDIIYEPENGKEQGEETREQGEETREQGEETREQGEETREQGEQTE